MKTPEKLHYSNEHLWTYSDGSETWLAGITDYAQDLLGDIVFVDAPKPGSELVMGTPCGLVESVKTGSDLHAPLSGKVIEINEALQGNPELLNDQPYKNWIFKFIPSNPAEVENLLDAAAYDKLVSGL